MPDHRMTADATITLLEACGDHGVDVTVGGGWGVDALLGEQTREHADLDLWLPGSQLESLFRALVSCGVDRVFPWPGDRPWNFVLHDGARHRVDLHLYERRPDNQVHYGSMANGVE